MADQEDDNQREARRILSNLQSQEGHLLGRTSQRLENHLNAQDADQTDRIEVWGTRIGRLISVALVLVVIVYALNYLLGT